MEQQGPDLARAILSDKSLLLAAFGALGGAVRSAAIRTSWREGVRVVFIGGATAFGVGEYAPVILEPIIGDGLLKTEGTIGALAFLVGLSAVTIIERVVDANRKREPNIDSESAHTSPEK